MAAKMNTTWRSLALAALALCAGCSTLRYEPTADWWRDGGRLCAAAREAAYADWDRATPRSCMQALADGEPHAGG